MNHEQGTPDPCAQLCARLCGLGSLAPFLAAAALFGPGCAIFNTPQAPADPGDAPVTDDGGSDSGGGGTDDSGDADGGDDGGDGGEDSGGDGGEDSGGDSGAESLPCDAPLNSSPPTMECVSSTIECGDSVFATTQGGDTFFDSDGYLAWYCNAFFDGDYSGSERVYAFNHPGTGTATFDLSSPCGELDLIVLRWEGWATDGDCPTAAHAILECEMDDDSGDGQVSVWQNSEAPYLVVVDGPDGAEENFELTVSCEG